MLLGWVHRVRDLGGVTFIDVRDRDGVSQVVVRENDALMPIAKKLRSEFVVGVTGPVQRRSDETVNAEARDGRGGSAGARDPDPERGEDAAVP